MMNRIRIQNAHLASTGHFNENLDAGLEIVMCLKLPRRLMVSVDYLIRFLSYVYVYMHVSEKNKFHDCGLLTRMLRSF